MKAAVAIAWLRHFGERLGWPGLLGIVLLAGAAAVEFVSKAELGARGDALAKQVARLQAEATSRAVAAAPESGAIADLPGSHALAPVIASVHAGARRRHVVLEQGEYLWQRDADSRTARYRMVFPVRGAYPQLRGWAADVLAANPGMSLEEFNFRRDNVGVEIVEAQVRFALRVEDRS